MAHFNNEAEFAGVLGHEIGHITARHSVSQQTKAILGQVGLIGSMILVPQVEEFAEPLSQGLELLFLKLKKIIPMLYLHFHKLFLIFLYQLES